MRGIVLGAVLGLSVGFGVAQVVDTPVPPDPDAPGITEWPTWGRDVRRSHYQPRIEGPSNPRVRWAARGGALEEPAFAGGLLWTPQMPRDGGLNNPRYVRYARYDPIDGLDAGAIGPFWGAAVTPQVINTPIYVFDTENTFVEFLSNWPAYAFAGGQYDSRVIAPDPGRSIDLRDGFPSYRGSTRTVIVRGRPAYRGLLGAYTDGAIGYAVFGDNFGGVSALGAIWIVTLNAADLRLIPPRFTVVSSEFVLMDDVGATSAFGGLSSAMYGGNSTLSDGLSRRLLVADHAGLLVAFDATEPLPAPDPIAPPRLTFAPVWVTDVQQLSSDDRLNPDDPTSPLDPIPSDAFDRPIVLNSDGSVAIVCASNFGRVYAVDTETGDKLWGRKLHNEERFSIMAGPSIGPDPIDGGAETVYVVARTRPDRSELFALDLATGRIKWRFNLQGISRCTPTIDAAGNLYIGNDRGFLFRIRPNGTLQWSLYLGAPIQASPVLARVPDLNRDGQDDPLLYVATSNRFLFAIENRPNPQGTPGGGGIGTPTP